MVAHGLTLVRENRIIIQVVKERRAYGFPSTAVWSFTESLQHGAHYTRLIQFVNPSQYLPKIGNFPRDAFRCGNNRPVPVPSPESLPSRVGPPEVGHIGLNF